MDSIIGNEYLPNVHIESINYQTFDGYQKATVTAAVYDHEDKTWSADDKFTGYFSISCFMVWQKQLIQQINSGEITLSNLPTGQNVFKLKASFNSLEETTVSIRGKIYTKYKKTFSFTVPVTIINLSCFSISMIEIEDLKQNENLDLSYTNNLSYMGSLKSEKIIENNSFVTSATVFRDEEQIPWSGPVHGMESIAGGITIPQGYMAGSQHGETPEKTLTIENIPFTKIKYLTGITTQLPEALDGPSSTTPLVSSEIVPASSLLHQMEFVEDLNRNVSNSSVIDLEGFYLQESPVAQAMYRFDREAFIRIAQATNLQNIEINRFPTVSTAIGRFNLPFLRTDYSQPSLVAMSSNNSRKVKSKSLFKVSPRERISVDPEMLSDSLKPKFFNGKNLTRQMLKGAQRIGSVEQLNLTLPANLRTINFTDYEVKTKAAGKYKYQIKVSMEDECLKYCKNLLQELTKYSKNIENLYNVIIMKNVYTGDEFKIEFLQEFYSQYNISVDTDTGFVTGEFNTQELRDSYLVKAFETLLSAEKLIGTTPRAPSLTNTLNMFSTDPESILSTLEYYNVVISRFKDTYDLSDGKGTKKSSSKKRKDRGILDTTINLKEHYERKQLMPIGLNFISMDSQEGMPKINFDLFNQRTNMEVKKFFPGVINANSSEIKALPQAIQTSFANIEENKFTNFSPAKFIFGGKEVNTTEINPESFNADFFNTIRVTRAALKANESTEKQDDLGPIEESNLEKYIDSREFLGDETKFNRAVFNTLLRKPLVINNIRKKFKLMDNKVLKSNTKKISLKTFDLTQPDNKITKTAMLEPKSIPLQIKALSLLKTPMTNFDLNTIEFDPLSNPQTQEVFTQNYLNIGKVQYLEGFERINGRMAMDKPIYKEIELKNIDNIKEKNVLCKIVQNSFNGLTTDSQQFNVHDKVFVMNNVQEDQINSGDTDEQS